MGIDTHGLQVLQYAASKAPLGEVATLGRQNIHVDNGILLELLKLPQGKSYGPYCEELLIEQFGAISVTSFDASRYEGATVLHDMNREIEHDRQYDTTIDLGTLEHVFNLAVALRNVASLCKTGGRIIHVLPANNFNGHGFWQFSPELFFSLYSTENGFADTEVYIAELNDTFNWWKAAVPVNGVRVEYNSPNRSSVIVLTRKQAAVTGQTVQQSDYLVNWEQGQPPVARPPLSTSRGALHTALKRIPLAWRLADVVAPVPNFELSANNPHYTKVPLASLISRANPAPPP
jgi:hypothetical protein